MSETCETVTIETINGPVDVNVGDEHLWAEKLAKKSAKKTPVKRSRKAAK